MLGHQHLLQQCSQLDFTPGTACLDVGQHFLEVAYACGQGLHLAKPLMDHLQTLADQPKRIAQALLQGRLQLLIDGPTHLFQLAGIIGLNSRQAGLDRLAQLLKSLFIAVCQSFKLLRESIQLLPLQRR